MKQIFILLALSIFSYFSINYFISLKQTILNPKQSTEKTTFCSKLKKNPKLNFKFLLSQLFTEDGNKIEIYKNIKKINCYLDNFAQKQDYKTMISTLDKLIKLTDEGSEQNILIKELQKIVDEQNIQDLYIAVSEYYNKYKIYPRDLSQLKNQGFIEFIPTEPYGGQYYIDEAGRIKRTNEQ